MRRTVLILLSSILLLLAGCEVSTPVYTIVEENYMNIEVLFDYGDGETITTVARRYQRLNAPETPIKEGLSFLGWYKEDGELYDFSMEVTESFTLHARWESKTHTIEDTFGEISGWTGTEEEDVQVNL